MLASGTYVKKGKSSRSSMNSMERNDPEKFTSQSKRSLSSQSEKLRANSNRRKDMDRSVESVGSQSNGSVTRLRIHRNPFFRDSMNES